VILRIPAAWDRRIFTTERAEIAEKSMKDQIMPSVPSAVSAVKKGHLDLTAYRKKGILCFP
jgi:hypothetical protein